MIINIRYYVLTIASIFLALGVGIFIGFSFDAQEIIGSQKVDIVTQLEEKFNYLRSENENIKIEVTKLREEISNYEEFSKIIFPEIIKNRLVGIKVAIIETNDDYMYPFVYKVLEMAGADVTSVTTIKDTMLSIEPSRLKEIYNNLENGNNGNEEILETLITDLAYAIITGKDNNIIQALQKEELIDMTGNYTIPIDYLIIAGGSNQDSVDRIKKIDRKIIDFSKRVNIPIVGIEKKTANYSYIDEYKIARISSIDNVDSIIGQVSLILTMEGRPGNYGVKSSAESLMPTFYNIIDY